ncbi:ABC transporter substrate-binding protein [Sulfurimonas sp.]|nr:ABC transporter substrate-binding protein [Sulfurimonas sp.]
MFKKILLVCVSVLLTQTLSANEQKQLEEHFLSRIDNVISVVQNKELDKEKRNASIIKILTPMFDFELMAKLSLGKKYKKLSTEDKKRFVDLYVLRMKNSYSSKIDAYNDEKLEVKEILQAKKNRIALVTDLVSSKETLKIVYKFYKPKQAKKSKDTWLIYDVEILGVSILKTDKAQFREYLQTKSIQELMDTLAQKS